MKPTLKIIRIIVSLCIFADFTAAFLLPTGMAEQVAHRQSIPGKTQLFPSILRAFGKGVAGGAVIAGVILIVTFFFGRIYCSSLCPLGTLQDLINRISPRRRKKQYSSGKPVRRWFRYLFFAAVLLLFIGGVSVLFDLVEPFANFGRFEKHLLRPAVYGVHRGVAFLLEIGGVYITVDPLALSAAGTTLGAVTFAALFVLVFLKGRFFCTTICPTGAVLSLPASISRFRIVIDEEKCTSCGRCEQVCKSECIDVSGTYVDSGSCVACFSCVSACPFDAISYRWVKAEDRGGREMGKRGLRAHSNQGQEGIDRRRFLTQTGAKAAGIAALLSLPALRLISPARRLAAAERTLPIVPPGSGSIERFYSRCIACHVCVTKCPERVLVPAGFQYGLWGFEKPVMDYSKAKCEYECNVCSQVCPSGAIQPVSLPRKKQIQIGKAEFLQDLCVVFKDGTSCGACAEICPTTAVFMVPYKGRLTAPELTPDVCIGCGACEQACPVEGQKAIYVTSRKVHRTAKVRDHLPDHAAENGGPEEGAGSGKKESTGETVPPAEEGFAF